LWDVENRDYGQRDKTRRGDETHDGQEGIWGDKNTLKERPNQAGGKNVNEKSYVSKAYSKTRQDADMKEHNLLLGLFNDAVLTHFGYVALDKNE
jgi:hypothetical protein